MKTLDAEFQVGEWQRPHKLSGPKSIAGRPELAAVSCTCGWSVMTGRDMAKRMGRIHLDRAAEKTRR